MKEKYKIANEIAAEFNEAVDDSFLQQNYKTFFLLSLLYNDASKPIEDLEFEEVKGYLPEMSWEDTFSNVKEYLDSISPELSEKFDQDLFKVFSFIDIDNDLDWEERTGDGPAERNSKINDDDYSPHRQIEVHLEGTIDDASTIIHEYFHYLNDINKGDGLIDENRALLTEGISIYFESDYYNYLAAKYPEYKEIIDRIRLSRHIDTRSASKSIENPLYILYIAHNVDTLSENTYDFLVQNKIIRYGTKEKFEKAVTKFTDTSSYNVKRSLPYLVGTIISTNPAQIEHFREQMLKMNDQIGGDFSFTDCLKTIGVTIHDDKILNTTKKEIKELNDEYRNNSKGKAL